MPTNLLLTSFIYNITICTYNILLIRFLTRTGAGLQVLLLYYFSLYFFTSFAIASPYLEAVLLVLVMIDLLHCLYFYILLSDKTGIQCIF